MPENITLNIRLDPRAPFVIDIRELGLRPGSMRTVQRAAPAPAGLGLEMIGVPLGAPVALDLRLESVTEGVLVTGTVTVSLEGECGRCLGPVAEEFVADICELFAYPDSATDETTDPDEVPRVVDDYLDVEPVVRDTVVLGLPMTPLCRPECGGLCPDCGQRLDDLPADHSHEMLDPRWAALAGRGSDAMSSAASPSAGGPTDRTDSQE
jgi:uncharacterized protein